jgi:hypothetical protein
VCWFLFLFFFSYATPNAAWRAVGAAGWTDDAEALATLAARLAQ